MLLWKMKFLKSSWKVQLAWRVFKLSWCRRLRRRRSSSSSKDTLILKRIGAMSAVMGAVTEIGRLLKRITECHTGKRNSLAQSVAMCSVLKRKWNCINPAGIAAETAPPALPEDWGLCFVVCLVRSYFLDSLSRILSRNETNLIKESIRMGYNDFGDFHYAHRNHQEALKNYIRTGEYCTTSKHIVHMCLNAILASIELGQFTHATTHASKAEQTQEALDAVTSAKLRCAAGLAHLESKKYKLAAQKFLETGSELGNNYSEVIAPQDVATYGGLCALASFDRAGLKSKVIDNTVFKNFLELVPEIRELIQDFYTSRYASCLEYLGNLKANLMLDIHLHDHVETLYGQIRSKALIQYTHPFFNLKGFAIGNVLMDPAIQYAAYTDYALDIGTVKLCGTDGAIACIEVG